MNAVSQTCHTERLSFENFYGNAKVAETLFAMTRQERIPQTILLDGPEGVGKATLARRFAAALMGGAEKIEQDDLSLEANAEIIAEREKWPADKRNEDPLLFATHPDFLTFPPDGPLRQITIEQMRLLKERAQFKPLHGARRVFLIDHIDRANEQAANSLLKILEEPPEHLILLLTAENPYDLLPTIRSRAVSFHLAPLSNAEMQAFVASRGLSDVERRIALAAGSPGLAVSMDLEVYDERRTAMLKLLEVAAGRAPFAEWAKYAEAMAPRKLEKLDALLDDSLRAAGRCAAAGRGSRRNPQYRYSPRFGGARGPCFVPVDPRPRSREPTSCPRWCGAIFRRASHSTRWSSNCAVLAA